MNIASNKSTTKVRTKGHKAHGKGWLAKIISPYIWITPSVLLIVIVIFLPIFELFKTSVSKISLAGINKGFVGLKNYENVFKDPSFKDILLNTVKWTISVVGISIILAMGIALILNKKFPGRRIVRAVLIFPWATSLIITSSIWKFIFDFNYGMFNLILIKLHIINSNFYWLANAKTSFPILIWVGIFVTLPFTSFVILSGLQSIPDVLYESGDIDGASGFSRFYYITFPLLRESLTICIVMNVIYVFNSFPIIWNITKGDPANMTDTVITYLYKLAFLAHQVGQAAALSVVSFIVLLIFSIIYVSLVNRGAE